MSSKRKKRPDPVQVIEPTPEQLEKGEFGRQVQPGQQAAPYRRVPVIDTLFEEHKLTTRQFHGLERYRAVAIADERSPIADSIGKMMQGLIGGQGGRGPSLSAQRVAIELGRLERCLGALAPIARAIAVEDKTLSQWAMDHGGAIQATRAGVIKFEPTKSAFKIAWADIRMAGERLAAEIGA